MKEITEYRKFTMPAELDKAINTLCGIVEGINLDDQASKEEMLEIANWCALHRDKINRHPFSEIIPKIDDALSDGELTNEELLDILWLCNNVSKQSIYYNFITASIQQLEGIMQGALADNVLSDEEIEKLADWISEHDFLKGTYPFDELDSLLTATLSDGRISEDERNMLKAFFSNFIDLSTSYNLNRFELESIKKEYCIDGICAVCPDIQVKDQLFCFTGLSQKANRNEIAELIQSRGGLYHDNVTEKTAYLVVGNGGNPCWAFACYGRKVEKAVNLRKSGHKIVIVNETDFWDTMND